MNNMDQVDQASEWSKEFEREEREGRYPKWPNEVMVKALFGEYFTSFRRPVPSWKVLDVGCAFGNNLAPFADLGCKVYGIDIHPDIARRADSIMRSRGWQGCEFQEGHNRSIPYPDNSFDLLLSVNTLHYEKSEGHVMAALREFQRVLKPGGLIYICTVGAQHTIYKRAKIIGDHKYIVRDFGFRTGNQFFFFDNTRYLEFYGAQFFENCQTAEIKELYPNTPLHFLILMGQKK